MAIWADQIHTPSPPEFWMYELSVIRQLLAEFLRILENPGAADLLGQTGRLHHDR